MTSGQPTAIAQGTHEHDARSDEVDGGETNQAARIVADVSPEGRPANPWIQSRAVATMLVAAAILIVVAGAAAALLTESPTGLFVAFIGLVLLLVNPVVWASFVRARERKALLADDTD